MRRVFGRGGLRRGVHPTAGGRYDHKDCVIIRPVCKQDHSPDQPTPVEGAEIGDQPEHPTDDGKARLYHVDPFVSQLPFSEERAISEIEPSWFLGDVDAIPGSRDYGGYRDRKPSGDHLPSL